MEVAYLDTVQNAPATGLVYRFRFVAPGIAGTAAPWPKTRRRPTWRRCATASRSRGIASTGPQPNQIVISFSRPAGAVRRAGPEATQFFDAYRIEAGKCVWELF